MKGDDRNSREKPENLDMDKHPVSLACGERQLKQKSRHRCQARARRCSTAWRRWSHMPTEA
jgi:hypothetical protein